MENDKGPYTTKTNWTIVPLLGVLAAVAAGCAEVGSSEITNGQGEIAGEVTTTSVILQSRLTIGTELVEGDGACCCIRLKRSRGRVV